MTNAQENQLHYPLGERLPGLGEVIDVAPGVRWLRMRLPFALDHINLWLLRDRAPDGREGWAVVDCGIANDATRAAWEQVFANGLDGLPVLRVLVTHMHPDHIGLAHWLCERWGRPADSTRPVFDDSEDCRLWISGTDWNAARIASGLRSGFGGEPAARHFQRNGLANAEWLQQLRERTSYYSTLVPEVPHTYRRLMDGMRITIGEHEWVCIAGYGHAPEHIAFHCPALNVLISGDMVLPRISTNVSVIDLEPEANPLPLYLRSITDMLALPADTLVLPSHGRPFVGLHTRITQMKHHHDERFAEVLEACAEAPQSAFDLLPLLFKRPLDLHQTTFALGESIAHLHALQGEGRLRAVGGEDGVLRFTTVA